MGFFEMTLSEEQLCNWTKPWFNDEEERATKTAEIVKSAVNDHPVLKNLPIKIFPKGSYANNTNVRKDSDIDIAVEYQGMIQLRLPEGMTVSDTGLYTYDGISEYSYKTYLKDALEKEFGTYRVNSSGNKAFKIRGSDRIMDADIIPCTTLRYYYSKYLYDPGIELILNNPDGTRHFNFPEQHYNNGVQKNKDTSKRYKSIVRILKNVRNYLSDKTNTSDYHSFMIESLAYNVPNGAFLEKENWKEVLKDFCVDAWQYLKIEEPSEEQRRWKEANDIKFLFHPTQKWTREHGKSFILLIYNLIGD